MADVFEFEKARCPENAGVDSKEIVEFFNDMKENYYQFDIFMFDKAGNSSVRTSHIGRVYGENYQRSLVNRTYSSEQRASSDLIIDWIPVESHLLGMMVKYRNTLDDLVEKLIPGDVVTDTLFNFPVKGSIECQSLFLPEPLALDTFYTAPSTITFSK